MYIKRRKLRYVNINIYYVKKIKNGTFKYEYRDKILRARQKRVEYQHRCWHWAVDPSLVMCDAVGIFRRGRRFTSSVLAASKLFANLVNIATVFSSSRELSDDDDDDDDDAVWCCSQSVTSLVRRSDAWRKLLTAVAADKLRSVIDVLKLFALSFRLSLNHTQHQHHHHQQQQQCITHLSFIISDFTDTNPMIVYVDIIECTKILKNSQILKNN